jgi:hypothetical protein
LTEIVIFEAFPSLVWGIIFLHLADKLFAFSGVKQRVTPFDHVQPGQYWVISESFNRRQFAQAGGWKVDWEIEIQNPQMTILMMDLKLFSGR